MRSSRLKSIWGFFGLSGLVVDFESGFNDTNLVEVEKRPRDALALRLFTTTLTSLECIPLGIFQQENKMLIKFRHFIYVVRAFVVLKVPLRHTW